MRHQSSFAYHFSPLNIQVLENNSLVKFVPLVKTKTKQLKKHQFCSHSIYMSHQRSIVPNFFLLIYKY